MGRVRFGRTDERPNSAIPVRLWSCCATRRCHIGESPRSSFALRGKLLSAALQTTFLMPSRRLRMCGLVGYAATSPSTERNWLSIGRDAMVHRGPDAEGEWWSADGRVGLAHRRLAIIDLTDSGLQPMHSVEGGLSIVFNGEIYNFKELRQDLETRGHKFNSSSDTEVVLAAYSEWGEGCVLKLNGMFAFAIYDAAEQKLFLARDRAGEKPLFYRAIHGAIYFASELKALLANPDLPRRLDRGALDYYLMMGYVPGDRCILSGYSKLPAAHSLSFDVRTGELRVWRYWSVPEFEAFPPADESTLVGEFEHLLEDAVRRQLQADVPVGILLSGGVDSSLVTAMAVRNASEVRTFSIGFPGHARFDETSHARLIAEHFGTRHTELMADPTWADLIPLLSWQFDEPVADPSMIPTYVVSRLVREQCTVAVGGDGGDELFGGYAYYSQILKLANRAKFVPVHIRKLLAASSVHLLPVGFKGRGYLGALHADWEWGLPLPHLLFESETRCQLMKKYGPWRADADGIYISRIPHEADMLQRATRMDFADFLPEDILAKVDRTSMLNSLEVRAPLLDYRIVELAFRSIPSSLKATATQRKMVPKALTERLLPAHFDRQRKQGFVVPIARWLEKGPLRELFWNTLDSDDGIFDRRSAVGLLKGQDLGFKNEHRLFALVHFELWRRTHGVTF